VSALPDPSAEPAVRLHDLTVRFGDTTAVEGVSLEVAAGEMFGLLGPNGAGKTTTLRVLTTLLPAGSGTATVYGIAVGEQPMEVRRVIGFVPQQLSADAALTGRENVSLFARLYDVPRRQRSQRVSDVLEVMGLADASERLVATYSGGMIRRLELAQALVNRPRLLILDEPTIGLDPIARQGVWDRIADLRDETGMTVLLTTHYMDEADALCDRVALMHQGRIRAIGTPEQLKLELGPEATLEDVFRHHTGDQLEPGGDMRNLRQTRRTASRLG
jgi:ABC-2 type transport system ATP-binding protein